MSTFPETRTIDEFREMVGQEYGVSSWMDVTQDMIDQFADVTKDHQFIHVDVEKTKHTPFGGTIAHGFLTLSLMSAMTYEAGPQLKGVAMGLNYGMDKMRFRQMVKPGDVLELEVKVIEERHRMWQFSGTARVDGKRAATGTFMATIDRE